MKLPAATLRTWVVGRPYPTTKGEVHFPALIRPAQSEPPILSFLNLIEAHVIRALRTEHGVSIKDLRKALAYAERKLNIERLLLSPELRSDAGRLFLERYGELIDLKASGQLAMRQVFEAHLKRVTWDKARFPIRLYPFVSPDASANEMPVAIDASISFGRPVIIRKGISTAAIVSRIDAGESTSDLAADYGLTEDEIEYAVLYERAA